MDSEYFGPLMFCGSSRGAHRLHGRSGAGCRHRGWSTSRRRQRAKRRLPCPGRSRSRPLRARGSGGRPRTPGSEEEGASRKERKRTGRESDPVPPPHVGVLPAADVVEAEPPDAEAPLRPVEAPQPLAALRPAPALLALAAPEATRRGR